MDEKEVIRVLKDKALFYQQEKTYLYIKTKQGFKYNGTIVKIGESFIIFNDRYSGKIYISLIEIEKFEPNILEGKK